MVDLVAARLALRRQLPAYIAQFLLWLAIFTVALTALGHRARDFIPSFTFLYALSVAIIAIGQWDKANTYNLEPPLVALVLGSCFPTLSVCRAGWKPGSASSFTSRPASCCSVRPFLSR